MERTGIRYLAGALAAAIAAIHIGSDFGFRKLVLYAQAGQFPDPRPFLFVGSGMLIFLGIARVLDGHDPTPVYLGGIALMVAYLIGYPLWHTGLAHGAFWVWGPEPITHDEAAWRVVLAHLGNTPLAAVSKLLELALLGLLTVLYRTDSTTGGSQETVDVPGE
jgi:hypothetical protein